MVAGLVSNKIDTMLFNNTYSGAIKSCPTFCPTLLGVIALSAMKSRWRGVKIGWSHQPGPHVRTETRCRSGSPNRPRRLVPMQQYGTTHPTRQIAVEKRGKLRRSGGSSFSLKSDLLAFEQVRFNSAAHKGADFLCFHVHAGSGHQTCFQITPLTAQSDLVQDLFGHATASGIAFDRHQEQQLAPACLFHLQPDAVLLG